MERADATTYSPTDEWVYDNNESTKSKQTLPTNHNNTAYNETTNNYKTRGDRPSHRSFPQRNNQPTLMEIWKIARTDKDINKTPQRRKLHGNNTHTTFKRARRKRNNECMMCKQGGKLIECHTCTNTCHIGCDITMPTNVRHQEVVWRCQDCVKAEGHTNCKVAKGVEGHRQEYDGKLEDVWNTKHSWVGKEVKKMFHNVMYNGTIEQWMPDSKSEWKFGE